MIRVCCDLQRGCTADQIVAGSTRDPQLRAFERIRFICSIPLTLGVNLAGVYIIYSYCRYWSGITGFVLSRYFFYNNLYSPDFLLSTSSSVSSPCAATVTVRPSVAPLPCFSLERTSSPQTLQRLRSHLRRTPLPHPLRHRPCLHIRSFSETQKQTVTGPRRFSKSTMPRLTMSCVHVDR